MCLTFDLVQTMRRKQQPAVSTPVSLITWDGVKEWGVILHGHWYTNF